MDFLKEILGEELYSQFAEKVNAYNGNEANKEKQVKVANLGGGDYVGKAKYDSLQTLLDGKTAELDSANGLIAELKKAAKGDETLQGKITAYEGQIEELQNKLKESQLESSLKIALLEAGAADIDYLIYKAKNNSEHPLELGEDGKVKGVDNIVSGLKTQMPGQFKKSDGIKVDGRPIENGDDRGNEPKSLEEALRMQYENTN